MQTLFSLLFWLFILVISSWFLAEGADKLSHKIGRRFIGRIILGIATTLPEFAIVYFASHNKFFDVGIGAVFGSNILMISLGLSVMVLIATTRLSLKPAKYIETKVFSLDFYFLIITALISVILFLDGFDLIDGIIFAFLYFLYTYLAYLESKKEIKEIMLENIILTKKEIILSTIFIIIGSIGIFISADPFTKDIKILSLEIGIPAAILSLLIAPIAGEMPEKLSLMILARKGGKSVEISIGNIFGSKILNNTLLITTFILGAIFGANVYHIESNDVTFLIVAWAAVLTFISMLTFVDDKLSKKDGILLFLLYVITIILQIYFIPISIH